MRKTELKISALLALAFLLLSTLSLSDPILFLRDRVLFEDNIIFASDFIDPDRTKCDIPRILHDSIVVMVPGNLNRMFLDSRSVANRIAQILNGKYRVFFDTERILLLRRGSENALSSSFKEIECENIPKFLEKFMKDRYGDDVTVTFLNMDTIPTNGICSLSIPKRSHPSKRTSVLIRYRKENTIRVKSLTILLKRMRKVVVAKRKIKYGEMVGVDDLKLSEMDIFGMEDDVLIKIDDAIGKKARKSFRVGEIIKVSDLIDPPYVVRGQVVMAYILIGDLKITTFVRLMKDGKIGEVVSCRNIDSGKLIYGVVEEGPKIRVLVEGS